MAAGGRDLEREQRGGVAADVGQIGLGRDRARVDRRRRERGRLGSGEHLRRGPEARHTDDLQSPDERRLTGPFARHDQAPQPGAARSFGDRQRARRVTQLAA